jgi:23S rRNA pseudoU1915 N3-methylase RlmH
MKWLRTAIILNETDFRLLSVDLLLETIKVNEMKFNSWEELKEYLKEELELILEEHQASKFLVTLNQQSYYMLEEDLAETVFKEYKECFKEFVEEKIEI